MLKKIVSLMIVGFMSMGMCGCQSTQSTKKTNILIATSPDYPPYESLDSGNKMVGFDIDLAKELIKIMNKNGGNYSYTFKQMSFDTISSSIISGQVDLGIAGFSYHKEYNVGWSHKYNSSKSVALVNADSSIQSVSDLKGKKIGAQLGTTQSDDAKKVKGAKVTTVKDAKVLVETLKAGGLDAVILDDAVAENYVKTNGMKIATGALNEEGKWIITQKGNTKLLKPLDKAIDEFVKSSKYKELKQKWAC